MARTTQIEALRRQLRDERRKLVETAAVSGGLPPSGLLTYLANLESATLAVEAVLEERANLAAQVTVEVSAGNAVAFGAADRSKKAGPRPTSKPRRERPGLRQGAKPPAA